jgi:protocatechuate 3,4-dioxygenase beta subunit
MRPLLVLAALLVSGCSSATGSPATPAAPSSPPASTAGTPLAPAAASPPATCSSPTPAAALGPYFKAGSPERRSLVESGVSGTHLVLSGHVLSSLCRPVSGALLDFWQADGSGQYDNAGYRLRAHQLTAADGTYQLETVVPGLYPGRTEHIHVKVQAPGGAALISQLFFPNSSGNARDSLYSPALLVKLGGTLGAPTASFDFVLAS